METLLQILEPLNSIRSIFFHPERSPIKVYLGVRFLHLEPFTCNKNTNLELRALYILN